MQSKKVTYSVSKVIQIKLYLFVQPDYLIMKLAICTHFIDDTAGFIMWLVIV